MAFASILILGLVTVGLGDAPGRAAIAVPGPHGAIEAAPPAWDHAARPNPRRGGRKAILDCEESEEDTSDDPTSESALGGPAWRVEVPAADPLALRDRGPILSRSASPTLRLRC